jgi:hypothetical protein
MRANAPRCPFERDLDGIIGQQLNRARLNRARRPIAVRNYRCRNTEQYLAADAEGTAAAGYQTVVQEDTDARTDEDTLYVHSSSPISISVISKFENHCLFTGASLGLAWVHTWLILPLCISLMVYWMSHNILLSDTWTRKLRSRILMGTRTLTSRTMTVPINSAEKSTRNSTSRRHGLRVWGCVQALNCLILRAASSMTSKESALRNISA